MTVLGGIDRRLLQNVDWPLLGAMGGLVVLSATTLASLHIGRAGGNVAFRQLAWFALGLCALVEGNRALQAGRPADAEAWFRRATAPGASPDVARGAFLGLGDVRLSQGDIAGAIESYQQALAGGTPGDTISQRAQEKLNALGKAGP